MYDNLRRRDEARLTGIACGMAFSGEVLKFEDEEESEVPPIPTYGDR